MAAGVHEEEWAIDDVTGENLDPAKVRLARNEEMQFVRNIDLFDVEDIETSPRCTHRGSSNACLYITAKLKLNLTPNSREHTRFWVVQKDLNHKPVCASVNPTPLLKLCKPVHYGFVVVLGSYPENKAILCWLVDKAAVCRKLLRRHSGDFSQV